MEKRILQLGIIIPGVIVAALMSSRVAFEIWTELGSLSGERLTGYFALVFVSTAAWLSLMALFVDLLFDKGSGR